MGLASVLVAEDDENDRLLIDRAVKKADPDVKLTFVRDGEELIDYLLGRRGYSAREQYPLPGIVLMDLNMPRMNGFDVLTWLQQHPTLWVIPAIVWSSSAQESLVRLAYKIGAKAFIEKPSGSAELLQMMECLLKFWGHCRQPALEGT